MKCKYCKKEITGNTWHYWVWKFCSWECKDIYRDLMRDTN